MPDAFAPLAVGFRSEKALNLMENTPGTMFLACRATITEENESINRYET